MYLDLLYEVKNIGLNATWCMIIVPKNSDINYQFEQVNDCTLRQEVVKYYTIFFLYTLHTTNSL
jgi:hypothetical protein